MSDIKALPEGWQQTALSDVCIITMGQSPSSRDINNEGKGLPFYQGKTEFTDVYPTINRYCEVPLRVALQNNIFMSVRAPVGPVNIAKDKSGFGRGLCSIQCEYGIEHKYMFFQLRAMESHIASLGTGSTFTAINRDIVEGLSVNIAPEKEQTRIVEKLEELLSDLDNGVAELKKAQAKLGLYRQSLLKNAVEGQLTQQWREENRGTITETGQQLLERILKERRQRWEEQKLAEFAEKEKTPPKNWQSKYSEPVEPRRNMCLRKLMNECICSGAKSLELLPHTS
ncbi:restriction endonuclease subunit S [Endozoicomonas ascidiicola]|uniref:restriction endonuclease subunit S n=1 Tax=Endozoicomonas ascidiicola TaxID=1698521 RepID=UPI00082C9FC3|nr:restriction endonuclease subunit S [Endozoicomonas ascidiicola]